MKKLLTFVVLLGMLLSLQVAVASAQEDGYVVREDGPRTAVSIAEELGVSVEDLMAANPALFGADGLGLGSDFELPVGTELAIPVPASDEGPVDEAPVDEAPVDEAPVDEAPVDEVPVEETPVDEAPVDEAPVVERPVDEAPVDEAPVDEPTEGAVTERDEVPTEPAVDTSGDVSAAGAEAGPWSSTVFVSNPHDAAAGVVIDFYDTGGNIDASYTLPGGLNGHGSAVIDVSSVGIGDTSWQGSAVVQSENELAVQVGLYVNNSTDRELYSGFKDGSTKVFLAAAVCKAFDQTNTLAVQNVEGTDTTFTIAFKSSTGGTSPTTSPIAVKAYSTTFVDPCTYVESNWLGSATFESANKLVVVNHQPYMTQVKAIAYEGALQGYNKIFFPTALQEIYAAGFTSYYAIQNVGGSPTDVTLTVYNTQGGVVGSVSKTLGPLEKVSWQPKDAGASNQFLGSAVAQAGTGGVVAGITNIGTKKNEAGCPSGSGQTNAITQPGAGAGYVAVPWIENKSQPGWVSFLAVQNLGTTTSGNVTVIYYNANGSVATAQSLGAVSAGAKANSNPGSLGLSNFQGAVEVVSDNASDQLIVLTNNRSGNGCNGSATLGIPYVP